jgi:cobalt-zinc-cadmium efflux system membrane fusion protein
MRAKRLWTVMGFVVMAGGLGLGAYARYGPFWDRSMERAAASPPRDRAAAARPAASATPRGDKAWDGTIALRADQGQAIGVTLATVAEQTEPTRLDVHGTTAYDPSSLTRVRSRFSCLVSKVHVALGEDVKKGQPLVELFSTDLAEAKSRFEERRAQWIHDKATLDRVKPLFESRAVSEKDYFDATNDELKSQLEYKVARDNLIVFGLSDAEIAAVEKEDGSQKARMTLRAPADGLVITRDVVEGALYEVSDVLLVLAPRDHFWVIGNIYESDQEKVRVGQTWEIRFPFLDDVIVAKVEQMDTRVDPVTKTVQIRTSVPNISNALKSDMLVNGTLQIPPRPGSMVMPRGAVVVQDGESFVFVQVPGRPGCFARHEIHVHEEEHDRVIATRGVEPGDQVAVRGSLILAQIHENAEVRETGLPR